MTFEKDEVDTPGTMADEMEDFRGLVDDTFHWKNKKLDLKARNYRAAAQATLLLIDSSPDDARSEILQTKLFTLLMGEQYRSHAEVLFVYCTGAFVPSARNNISSSTLEFIHGALRRAQAYYMAMVKRKPNRSFQDVAFHIRVMRCCWLSCVVAGRCCCCCWLVAVVADACW